ncbi:MAG: POTRA domain-containing protein [Candidatus Sulfotelmatobacter sp.]
MFKTPLPRTIFAALFLTAFLNAQCAKDNREDKKGGIKITDFTISGTTTLTSDQLLRLTGDFIGNCYKDDNDEIEERLRAAFQDEGFFGVEVKKMDFKPGDPLAITKPVTVEAEIVDGPRYKLAEINFLGNHAFTAERLRREFPMKKGDFFRRSVVASSFESIRELYSTIGYLDMVMIPETLPSSAATMDLNLTLDEGPQYHMGTLEIVAAKEPAARLRSAWKLDEGSPYDKSYIETYLAANRDLLPAGFVRQSVETAVNCPDEIVQVRMIVDPAEDTTHTQMKDVPCEEPKDKSKDDPK